MALIAVSIKPNQTYGDQKTEFTLEITPWNNRSPPWDYYIYVNWRDGIYQDKYYYGLTGNDMPIRWPWSHRYASDGTYDVIVAVRDLYDGSQVSGYATLTVRTLRLTYFTANPTSGRPPLTVRFEFRVENGWLPCTYTLDFGDGSSREGYVETMPGGATQEHIYYNPGIYTAKLTVTDALGDPPIEKTLYL